MTVENTYSMIYLQESMGLGRDLTCNPLICIQTCICSQAHYRLHYAARYISVIEN